MQKARRIPLPWLLMGRRKLNFSTPPCFLIYYMWRLRHCLLQEETLKDESPPNMPISYPLYPAFFFAISSFFYLLFLFYSLKDKKLPGNDGSVYSFSSPEQAAVIRSMIVLTTQPNPTQHNIHCQICHSPGFDLVRDSAPPFFRVSADPRVGFRWWAISMGWWLLELGRRTPTDAFVLHIYKFEVF